MQSYSKRADGAPFVSTFCTCAALSTLLAVANRTLRAYLIVLLGSLLFPTLALSQHLLQPGDVVGKNDLPWQGQTVNNYAIEFVKCPGFNLDFSCTQNLSFFEGDSKVQFNLSEQQVQFSANVQHLPLPSPNRRKEAWARGKLFTEFCVVNPSTGVCSGTNDQPVTATISFQVAMVGRLSTFGGGARSNFGASARVRNLTTGKTVAFDALDNVDAGGVLGPIKFIKIVPVPLPEIADPEISTSRTFVIPLTRGHKYIFEVFGSAKSNLCGTPCGGFANANFFNSIQFGGQDLNGVKISNFSIAVGTDASADVSLLQMQIDSLQGVVGNLAERMDSADEALEFQISNSGAEVDSLNERISNLEADLSGLSSDVAQLNNGQSQLNTNVAEIEQEIQELNDQLATLHENLSQHTHTYLTGKGNGHNNMPATTESATTPNP